MSSKKVDLSQFSEFDTVYNKKPQLYDYLEFVKEKLSPDFDKFQKLALQFDSVMAGTQQNLIDIKLVLSVANEVTANKIAIVTEHLNQEIKYNELAIDENQYSYIVKETANLSTIAKEYLSYRLRYLNDLLLYIGYNNLIHQTNLKPTFLEYRAENKNSDL